MARKKKEDTILEQLEIAQAQEVLAVDTKLRNQVVLSLLHSASVYSISDEGVLRARVRRCMEIADIVVDELEKKND